MRSGLAWGLGFGPRHRHWFAAAAVAGAAAVVAAGRGEALGSAATRLGCPGPRCAVVRTIVPLVPTVLPVLQGILRPRCAYLVSLCGLEEFETRRHCVGHVGGSAVARRAFFPRPRGQARVHRANSCRPAATRARDKRQDRRSEARAVRQRRLPPLPVPRQSNALTVTARRQCASAQLCPALVPAPGQVQAPGRDCGGR